MINNTTASTRNQALICIGEPDLDLQALQFAERVIVALEFEPVLMHILPKEGDEDSDRLLQNAMGVLQTAPEVRVQAEKKIEPQLKEEASLGDYRLIVIGTTLHPKHERLTKRAQRIAIGASDSVLAVHNPSESIQKLLICTGGQQVSNRAMEWGFRIAHRTGAEVTVLHVASTTPLMYTGLPAVDEGMDDLLSRDTPLSQHLRMAASRAEEMGLSAQLELRHGMVVEEILRACDIECYDLVVIGSPEPGALFKRWTLGDVAPELLSSTPTSTLIVRSEVEED
jgi:nucleotide-binding universal stress UspA family protein